jgi:hypothetical protein
MSTVKTDSNPTNVFGGNVCDTCGERATHAVRNRVEEPSDSDLRRFTYGPWRFGCDVHEKKRTTKYLNGVVEQAA